MRGISVRSIVAPAVLLFFSCAQAATLDFTIPTSGFAVQSFTDAAGSSGGFAIVAGNIVSEAGFATITLDIDGENLDIIIDDVLDGNPYFDAISGGHPGGMGSCQNLTAGAQCDPSSDDNITISASETLRMDFATDSGAVQSVSLGDFIFRDDNHLLIDGIIQVSHDGGSALVNVALGIGDLSGIGSTSFLAFNDLAGSTQNFYISAANLTAVPIPAAVWLFGSALGLLGWMRRKQ